jgi:uncharacterized membrane protein YphA (DoxX/SURF4 family)
VRAGLVALFDAIGAGQWLRYVTGSIEVVSGLALLVPSLAAFGALLLVPTMVGAVATHLLIVGGLSWVWLTTERCIHELHPAGRA